MAPNLTLSQHQLIQDIILSKSFLNDDQIARTAGCSTCAIRRIRSNLRCFRATKVPPNGGGRPRSITPPILSVLRNHLLKKPEIYQDEIVLFLLDEFEVLVIPFSISRALASVGWSKKTTYRITQERNADLRDLYLYNLSNF